MDTELEENYNYEGEVENVKLEDDLFDEYYYEDDEEKSESELLMDEIDNLLYVISALEEEINKISTSTPKVSSEEGAADVRLNLTSVNSTYRAAPQEPWWMEAERKRKEKEEEENRKNKQKEEESEKKEEEKREKEEEEEEVVVVAEEKDEGEKTLTKDEVGEEEEFYVRKSLKIEHPQINRLYKNYLEDQNFLVSFNIGILKIDIIFLYSCFSSCSGFLGEVPSSSLDF